VRVRCSRSNYNEVVDQELAAAAERLRLALELFEAGESMMRERLRRDDPHADEAEIEARLVAWLHQRPGAENGDAAGRPVSWPRPRR
jgi:Rv0078B-related antitoxin